MAGLWSLPATVLVCSRRIPWVIAALMASLGVVLRIGVARLPNSSPEGRCRRLGTAVEPHQ